MVPIPFVLVRDPFLMLKKRMGPTLNLKTARNGLAAPDLKQKKRVNIPNKHYATTEETPWKRKLCSLITSKKTKVCSGSIMHILFYCFPNTSNSMIMLSHISFADK